MNAATPAQEGYAEVPGARLRYRLGGTQRDDLPPLVFENGWGASWECWAHLEPHLVAHARLLFYNRAGIGGSVCKEPQSVAGLGQQLEGLLATLQIREPVILVGHSYGGLMCAMHAARKPALVRGMFELDPSPDSAEPILDRQMQLVLPLARLAMLCARLGIADPPFSSAGKRLPPPHGQQLVERSFGSAASLRASVEELKLLDGLRAAIAAGSGGYPQLIVSAGQASALKGWAGKFFGGAAERAATVVRAMQAQHRRRAARNPDGRWETLPYDHGSLVFSEAGAQDSAARLLRFVREHCR